MRKAREREKTLKAGQRGGAKGARNRGTTSGPARDKGGRVIRSDNGSTLRTQSARNRGKQKDMRGEKYEMDHERGIPHGLSPGQRVRKDKKESYDDRDGEGKNRFGFKGGKGSGPPRDAGGRLIRPNMKETKRTEDDPTRDFNQAGCVGIGRGG